jgi:4-amino-4-deoxy-L-arabinose transferase-like glycosyltransferase
MDIPATHCNFTGLKWLPSSHSGRVVVLLIVALSALEVVKTVAFIAAGQSPPVSDALVYWYDGGRIAAGDWLLLRDEPVVERTPGYLLFVACFRATCGARAHAMAIVAQQLLLLASVVVTCWVCWRLNKTKTSVLLALVCCAPCMSSHGVAVYLLSDTLLAFTVTLCIAAAVAWSQLPSVGRALAAGAVLGVAILIKPVAQYAWIPLGMWMVLCSHGDTTKARRLVHAACMSAAAMALTAPWMIRNEVYFGSPFLSKILGPTLWWACYTGDPASRIDPPLPFTDGPATQAVLRAVPSVDPREAWEVRKALMRQAKFSEIAADDLMLAAAKEGISAYPWRYGLSRCVRAVWFWVTPNGTYRPLTGRFEISRGVCDVVAGNQDAKCEPLAGQVTWQSEWYFEQGLLNYLWFPHPLIYGIAGVAVFLGLAMLLRVSRHRVSALLLASWLGYFALTCALATRPEYRYRMILEPTMIIVVVTAAECMVAARRRGSCSPTLETAARTDRSAG